MKTIFLIGHRGVGKTTLLEDYKVKSKSAECFDLDQEIELRTKTSIHEFFLSGRVADFRKVELQTLRNLLDQNLKTSNSNGAQSKTLIISLGAGFELENFTFPKESLILWIRRATDPVGRIFTDRPALTKQANPLAEWKEIFKTREIKYQNYANAQMFVPECFDTNFNPLYEYLNFAAPSKGFVTLIPDENDKIVFEAKCQLELRTDLLSEKYIVKAIEKNLKQTNLIAIRKKTPQFLKEIKSLRKKSDFMVDWDMALGFPPANWVDQIDIYSSHDNNPIAEVLVFLEELAKTSGLTSQKFLDSEQLKSFHFKICPEVSSHEAAIALDAELSATLSPLSYSFLPRSTGDLDLTYFRQLKSHSQKIGFYRFGNGSSKDQPLWWQWPKDTPKGFYGIFGENIKHSYTPGFHFHFFKNKNLYPLSISEFPDFFAHIKFFISENLKALAVTSPYKNLAFENSKFQGTSDNQTADRAANTLIFDKEIVSFNTDSAGLKTFLANQLKPEQNVVLWGGGALLPQLQELLPQAISFSAQTGQPRTEEDRHKFGSKKNQAFTLIWASGEKGNLPDSIKINNIIDLDYRDNSRAKLYSYQQSLTYVSGLEFFQAQALAQQKIWDGYEF